MTNTTEQDTPKKTPKKKDKGSDLPAPLLGFFGLYLGYLLRAFGHQEAIPQVVFITNIVSTFIMFIGVVLFVAPLINYIKTKHKSRTKNPKTDPAKQKSD